MEIISGLDQLMISVWSGEKNCHMDKSNPFNCPSRDIWADVGVNSNFCFWGEGIAPSDVQKQI